MMYKTLELCLVILVLIKGGQSTEEAQPYRSTLFKTYREFDDALVDTSDVIFSVRARSTMECSRQCLEEKNSCLSFVFDRACAYCVLLSIALPRTTPPDDPVQLKGKYLGRTSNSDTDSSLIDEGGVGFGGKQYIFYILPLTDYLSCKTFCLGKGANLLEIKSPAEWDFLRQNVPVGVYITGATDQVQRGTFVWGTSGQPVTIGYGTSGVPSPTYDCLYLVNLIFFPVTLERDYCAAAALCACEKEL